MSWLLFMDESGHDHRSCPFEVRGGVALHTKKLWHFVQSMRKLEEECFGCQLSDFGKEIKGSTLLDRKRFKFAGQDVSEIPCGLRQKRVRSFFEKGKRKESPTREEFEAYGQACITMAQRVFEELDSHDAFVFASIVPRSISKPNDPIFEEYLRKDHVFLLERYFYMLEEKEDEGLLIMDEVEKTADRKFVKRMERYYVNTDKGRYRATRVIPTPLFVASDMAYAVQAADICIYAINWGYREIVQMGNGVDTREEISSRFNQWLRKLQYVKKNLRVDSSRTTNSYGIFYVPDPYATHT